MLSVKALRQKRADLVQEAQKIFETATAESRGLTAEETKRDDAIGAELDALNDQVSRIERQMDRQRNAAVAGDANQDADGIAAADGKRGDAKPTFKSLGEQLMAVARAGHPDHRSMDPRLVVAPSLSAATGMSEGIAADGGFLVQSDFASELLQNLYTVGEIAQRVRKIPIGPNSNGIKMNGVDETSRVNGSRWGGIQAFWTGEAQQKTASTPKFRRIAMELDKLTGLCYATDELLQDSMALEAWLRQAFDDEFTFKVEDAIVNGTGAGMPLGILNSGAVITVNKEGSQAAATITANNILAMWARLPARSRKNAVWLVNVDTEPQLGQLYTVIKNVAGTENVGGIASVGVSYTPAGYNGNEYATLMGRPVIPCEYCATLGTAGDLILADLTQYLAIDKGPSQFGSSIHVRFIYDETVFRFVYRFNGQPIWRTAMTPYKGTNTQSPFIVLQTR